MKKLILSNLAGYGAACLLTWFWAFAFSFLEHSLYSYWFGLPAVWSAMITIIGGGLIAGMKAYDYLDEKYPD